MFNVISEYILLEYWHVEGYKHKRTPLKPSLSVLLLCTNGSSVKSVLCVKAE